MSADDMRQRAQRMLRRRLSSNRRFPANVFIGDWATCFFFDADRMFDVEVVDIMKSVLDCEGARCVLLALLDVEDDAQEQVPREFLFTADTRSSDYHSQLQDSRPGYGWLYELGRFGCVSELGGWCIYGERRAEVAVMAVRGQSLLGALGPMIEALRGLRLEDALRTSHIAGLTPPLLSRVWKAELLRNYM